MAQHEGGDKSSHNDHALNQEDPDRRYRDIRSRQRRDRVLKKD